MNEKQLNIIIMHLTFERRRHTNNSKHYVVATGEIMLDIGMYPTGSGKIDTTTLVVVMLLHCLKALSCILSTIAPTETHELICVDSTWCSSYIVVMMYGSWLML